MSWPIGAAVTKFHRLSGLNNKHLCLTIVQTGKSKIKGSAGSVSGEPWLPELNLCVPMWQKGTKEFYEVSFIRALNPIHECSMLDLITFQRPLLPITLHWELYFNMWILVRMEEDTMATYRLNINRENNLGDFLLENSKIRRKSPEVFQ